MLKGTVTAEEIQNLLRSGVDPDASVLAIDGDDEHGVVLWQRFWLDGFEYIVHRWALTRLDGSPIAGGLFYSGYYTTNEHDARTDYKERSI